MQKFVEVENSYIQFWMFTTVYYLSVRRLLHQTIRVVSSLSRNNITQWPIERKGVRGNVPLP